MRQKVLVLEVMTVCGLAWLVAGAHGPLTVGALSKVPLPVQYNVTLPTPGTMLRAGAGAAATS